MRLGIDASNIRAGGGGVAHLRGVLTAGNPPQQGLDEVFVWSGTETLAALPDRSWLHRVHEPALDRGLASRTAWRLLSLDKRLKQCGADVLFAPGGIYTGRFRPFIAMSQNMLPWQDGERQRYGWSLARLRLELIRRAQTRTFARANGVIFPTELGKKLAGETAGLSGDTSVMIPCGIGEHFRLEPRAQEPLHRYSEERPFRLLYVSRIEVYKHQWNVVAAVGALRQAGLPVALDLVGQGPELQRLEASIEEWDPTGEFINTLGLVPDLVGHYHGADAAVFASSCETPGFSMLESMSAGLPIACADRSAMPEFLGDAAEYFDPEDPESIAAALQAMIKSPQRRQALAERSYRESLQYTWEGCAERTFRMIADVARQATSRKT